MQQTADPTGLPAALAGLDGSSYDAYQERAFETWVKIDNGEVQVQGRLRFSADLAQANQFFIDVAGESLMVRLQVPFKTFQQHNLPYFCGTPVFIKGNGTRRNGEVVISSVQALQSLLGIKPR